MSSDLFRYQAYAQATHTVAKTRQIVMLYDGAIRNIRQAKEAITAKRYEDRLNLLSRTSDILLGLQSALDFDQGGDIAKMLYDFYGSLEAQVRGIHRSNNLGACDEVIKELKDMRDSWDRIDQQNAAKTPHPMAIDPAIAGAFQPGEHGAMAISAITA